jgi:hypothetical protein
MESDESKKLLRTIDEKNNEGKRIFHRGDLAALFRLSLDTAFGISSTPIHNQLQVVGEKYVVFMVGSIVVVKDLADKTEHFHSCTGHFNNVTALFAVSKEAKLREKGKSLDGNGNPIYLPNSIPVKLYLAESSDSQDRFATIVVLKPYRNRTRTLSTGLKGSIKEIAVDRPKKTLGCLLVTPQSTFAIIFNYRKEKLLTSTCLKNVAVERLSFHPLKPKSTIMMGRNYLRLWELHPQENVLKENQQLVPLKV